MDVFVLVTVKASSGMYEDGGGPLLFLTKSKHTIQRTICAMAIVSHHRNGRTMAPGAHPSQEVMGVTVGCSSRQ